MKFLFLLMLPCLAQAARPLKTTPIHQYSCYQKSDLNEYHFYFNSRNAPVAVDQSSSLVCHDVYKYGQQDRSRYPRLGLVKKAFSLWSALDHRFYDNDGNGWMDVDDLIAKKIQSYGGHTSRFKLFNEFKAPESEVSYREAGSTVGLRSFFTTYFVDASNFRAFCLGKNHYQSINPLYKALGDVIGVETEGLYLARPDYVSDAILLSESDIKKVWFYFEAGVPTRPNEENIQFKSIYFYYPLNKNEPLIGHAGQKLYRVEAMPVTGYPSHDRRIGCIPKL